MAISKESLTKDAPASLGTQYCFVPNEDGSFSSASKNNEFKGTLYDKFDEDWILIELQAGKEYTFTLTGDDGGVEDPILMLLDSKGGLVATNDDMDAARGDLGSQVEVPPDYDGKFYLSVSAYKGNPGQTNQGAYTLTVRERPAGPADIIGTEYADKLFGTDAGESISGKEGADVLEGRGGDDELDGGDGPDLLTGGPGADAIEGGKGIDTISYEDSAEGEMVSINLRSGSARGGDAEGDVLDDDIENVIGARNAENMLTGDRGENRLVGGNFSDVLVGDRGKDVLIGGGGDDELDGGDDNDTLNGGAGADELTGGDGDDTASYDGGSGVTVRLHSNQAMGGDAEGDTFVDMVTVEYDNPDPEAERDEKVLEETVPDIIHLDGSGAADVLAGDSRDNTLSGGGGDDKLYGGPGGGDDKLYGGSGNDMLFGGIGVDTLHGELGDDRLSGGGGADTVYGGYGSDMIYSDAVADANGNGQIVDAIDGWVEKPGTDKDGKENKENIKDPHSVDTVSYEKVRKIGVTATLGTEIKNVENMIGSDQDDILTGDKENNVIEGGDGADTLDGKDHVAGGGDTVSYVNSDRGVNVDLSKDKSEDRASGGHAQGDNIKNFENVTGSAHSDVLIGDNEGNTLKGLADDDELIGGQGADIIEGGAGADELDGDDGRNESNRSLDDTLSYASSDAGVSVNLATVSVSGGHASGDEIEVQKGVNHDGDKETDEIDVSTFENATGSMHNDRLTGDHRANTLNGLAGNDTLKGGALGDILIGGPGADSLDGGEEYREKYDMVPGKDGKLESISESAKDTVSYNTAMAGVTVDLTQGKGTGGDAMGDTYHNIEKYEGSFNDDTFIASEAADVIDAGDHNRDNDGKADDGDTISYEASETGVNVNLEATVDEITKGNSDSSDGRNENYAKGDNLTGFENVTGSQFGDMLTALKTGSVLNGLGGNDTLNGGDNGVDTLIGGKGRDTLQGFDGNDTLIGGSGDDVMSGGKGGEKDGQYEDTFVFSPHDGNGDDLIKDFLDPDKIDLTAFGITAEDLVGVINVYDDDVQIDLTSFGGGKIILEGVKDVDVLDAGTRIDDGMFGGFTDTDTGVFILG